MFTKLIRALVLYFLSLHRKQKIKMKSIIVTGASRGIGNQIALKMAAQGHRVLALSRQVAQNLLGNPNIHCLSLDISDADQLEKVAVFLRENHWTNVDALIHNAGAILVKPFSETTRQDFEKIYGVNVFAVAALTQVILPCLQQGSHVVTISSMGGIQGSMKFAGLAAYSSSKGAVITLSELLAEEYRERGISFNVLALGSVQTEMLAEAFPGYQAPLSADQMADYIVNFALEGQKYQNGRVIEVSSTTP